jgi:predicted small lipoprotein YifL
MRRIGLIVLAASTLAGCGLREPLQPPPGASLPVAPAGVRTRPDAEALLIPPPITRPSRVDEIVRRSELREDDRFDLPPPEVPAGVVPIPVENGEPQGSGPE